MNSQWNQTAIMAAPLAGVVEPDGDMPMPAWWLGGAEHWREVGLLYARLRGRDRRALRACRWGLAGALIGLVGLLYAGLAHSVTTSSHSGIDFGSVGAGFLLLILVSMAAYEVALLRRGRYVEMCAELWGELAGAVREGLIDGPAVFVGSRDGRSLTEALRLEVETALRHRAGGGALQPRLTHFSTRIFDLRPVAGADLY